MTDLITPVIIGGFGAAMLLVVFGFILILHRTGKPRFESQDYYKSYRSPDRFSQPRSTYRGEVTPQDRREQRTIIAVIVILALVAIIITAVFEEPEGLLIIFLLPIIVRYIRTRNQSRKREPQDEGRSY
jgi:hypothetical protein